MADYKAVDRGATWSVYDLNKPILHNLTNWQAKAISAILNSNPDQE